MMEYADIKVAIPEFKDKLQSIPSMLWLIEVWRARNAKKIISYDIELNIQGLAFVASNQEG